MSATPSSPLFVDRRMTPDGRPRPTATDGAADDGNETYYLKNETD